MLLTPALRLQTCLLIAVFAALATSPASRGQDGAGSAGTGSLLEATPFEAEGLGLKINLPTGSQVVAERLNGQLVLSIADNHAMPTWNLRVQTLIASRPGTTAAQQIEDLLREFQAARQQFQVIANRPYTAIGVPDAAGPGQICYVQRTFGSDQVIVSGWLLLPVSDAAFLVFALQTLPEHLPRIRPALEASFATIQLRSMEDINAERRQRLEAGADLIKAATPERLKSLVGLKQWLRIHRPSQSEAAPSSELGYSLLEVIEAKKGALNPEKPERSYDAGERKDGIMIRIQGRIVINPERHSYYDSIALYWMAWDQSEESWSIRGTHRQGEAEQSEAETGIRYPYLPAAPPPRISVIKSNSFTNERDTYDWDVPEVYLSQPLGWLIARLLPTDGTHDVEYRWYFYNFANRVAQISQRSDVWGPMNDGSGNFRLLTRLTSDSAPITSIYNPKGELIRRIHPDGSLTEPATVESIHRLWRSKGLQVGGSTR